MTDTKLTTAAVARRFMELAKEEKWFEIQDELFAENVVSMEPLNSTRAPNAAGKQNVKRKGEAFVKEIEAVHEVKTGEAIVSANHFAVTRYTDITLKDRGRERLDQIMLYEVKDGKIISEQFFYSV